MKARFHFLAQAALAGSLVAPLHWCSTSIALGENPSGAGRVRSLPYHKPPGGNKAPLLARLVAAPTSARSEEQQQSTTQRTSSGGITLERLWDKWQGRRGTVQQQTPGPQRPRTASSNSASESDNLQLETPQPVRPEGEFPPFRTDNQSPLPIGAPAPQSAPSVVGQPVPRPTVRPAGESYKPAAEIAPQPAKVQVESRPIVARPIEPAAQDNQPPTARITVRTTEAPKPIAAPAPVGPRRSTAAYLADEVRYGAVIRRTSSTSSDPTAGILGETSPIEVAQSERPIARPSVRQPVARSVEAAPPSGREADSEFDTVFSHEAAAVPQVLPLGAEDLGSMASMQPAPSARFHGGLAQVAGERTSSSASPAMLQQALRHYGTSTNPSMRPQPSTALAEPVLEQPIPAADAEASQRSVLLGGEKPLGIQRTSSASQHASQNQRNSSAGNRTIQGSVAGVDKQHGTILVQFPGHHLPAIGSKVQVYQKILIKRDLLGEFRVLGVQGNAVVAQPIGKLDLDLILNGDEATAI